MFSYNSPNQKKKKLLRAVSYLEDSGINGPYESSKMKERIETLYIKWVDDAPPKKRGRRIKDPRAAAASTCQKNGCNKHAASGQVFCSKRHAPWGHL